MPAPNPRTFARLDAAMLVFTGAVLALLVAESADALPALLATWFVAIDTTACAIFAADFAYRCYWAEDRWAFARRNWIDLAASIPLQVGVENLRWGRMFRMARAARVLRGARAVIVLSRFGSGLWTRQTISPETLRRFISRRELRVRETDGIVNVIRAVLRGLKRARIEIIDDGIERLTHSQVTNAKVRNNVVALLKLAFPVAGRNVTSCQVE